MNIVSESRLNGQWKRKGGQWNGKRFRTKARRNDENALLSNVTMTTWAGDNRRTRKKTHQKLTRLHAKEVTEIPEK